MKNGSHKKPAPAFNDENKSARSEIQKYLHIRQQRQWIFPRVALVGVCARMVALGLQRRMFGTSAIHWGEK
jgi:hypothetical protein